MDKNCVYLDKEITGKITKRTLETQEKTLKESQEAQITRYKEHQKK